MPTPQNPAGMNAPDYLVESIPNPLHGPASRRQNPWLAPIFPLLVSTAAAVLCYRLTGPTLGLFIGGLFCGALLAGPFVAAEETWLGRVLATVGVVHGIAGVWLYASAQIDMDLGLWAAAYLSLDALVVALAAIAILLRALRFGPIGAAAVATMLGIAWLTWPVWLSPALGGTRGEQIVAWLVPAHPLFAMNSALRDRLDYWAAQGIAYNLTKLDEIAYTLPTSVGWCAAFHAALAACCVLAAGFIGWRREKKNRMESPSS